MSSNSIFESRVISFENLGRRGSGQFKQNPSITSFQHGALESRLTWMSPEASLRTWMPAIHAGMTKISISFSVGERKLMNLPSDIFCFQYSAHRHASCPQRSAPPMITSRDSIVNGPNADTGVAPGNGKLLNSLYGPTIRSICGSVIARS